MPKIETMPTNKELREILGQQNAARDLMKAISEGPAASLNAQIEAIHAPIKAMIAATETSWLKEQTKALSVIEGLKLPNIAMTPPRLPAIDVVSIVPKIEVPDFTIPEMAVIADLSRQVAEMVKPPAYLADIAAWQKDLAARMAGIETVWAASARLDASAFAFARLTRLGETVGTAAPFDEATSELVDAELGNVIEIVAEESREDRESRYDRAGRNEALIAFPEPQYPAIMLAAGFNLPIPAAPVAVPIENGAGPALFDPSHHAALSSLEVHLREFVVVHLTAMGGTQWLKQRIPGEILKRWRERQQQNRDAGRPVYEIIHYADFTDLCQIIVMKPNWDGGFKAIFRSKEDLTVSLGRLAPIRNDIAHNRPLSQTDILVLATETMRLFAAIGQKLLVA